MIAFFFVDITFVISILWFCGFDYFQIINSILKSIFLRLIQTDNSLYRYYTDIGML